MSVQLESRWIAANLGCPHVPSVRFKSVTTDSRKVSAGALFVAIPGEKFDGHQFLEAAVAAGATGILAQTGKVPASVLKQKDSVAIFEVADTTEAFRKIAGVWRRFLDIPVIVVAGSVGKTTTKELLTAILRGRYSRVVSTQGSQNGFLGIPITLFDLTPETEAAVVEVGIDEIGAMERHIDLVQPTFSLLTSIAEEHLEKLIDLPTVAREERQALFLTHQQGGKVLIRLDDPWIAMTRKNMKLDDRVFTCSMERDEDPNVRHFVGTYDSARNVLQVKLPRGSTFELPCPLPGAHNAGNLLTACATALSLGLSPMEVQRGLQSFRGAVGRSELKTLANGTHVICDYYNANPASVEAGLELLRQIRDQKKKQAEKSWAILGDMLELGTLEEELHRGLAKKILAVAPDGVLLYGNRMRSLQDELQKRNYAGVLEHFADHASLAKKLLQSFQGGDFILIKGSRGMKMEEVFKKIDSDSGST